MPENSQDSPRQLSFDNVEPARMLFGEHNCHLQRIANALALNINTRGSAVHISGDAIASALAENILKQLYGLIQDGYPVYLNDIDYAIRILSADDRVRLKDIFMDTVYITSKKAVYCA